MGQTPRGQTLRAEEAGTVPERGLLPSNGYWVRPHGVRPGVLLRVGLLRLGRRLRRAALVRVDDPRDGLFGRVREVEQVVIFGRDHPVGERALPQPGEHAL